MRTSVRSTLRIVPAALVVLAITACDKGQSSTTPPPETVVAEAEPAGSEPTDADTAPPPAEAPSTEDDGGEADAETQADPAASTGTWVDPEGPVPVPEDPSEGLSEPTSFANVKLEIKTSDGKVMRDKGKVIAWRQPTKIPFEFQGGVHEFVIDVVRDGKTANVELSYELDGMEVLRTYELETQIGKREVIRIEDGTALALTVTSKTIKPKTKAEREKIEARKGKDPLSGAKK